MQGNLEFLNDVTAAQLRLKLLGPRVTQEGGLDPGKVSRYSDPELGNHVFGHHLQAEIPGWRLDIL